MNVLNVSRLKPMPLETMPVVPTQCAIVWTRTGHVREEYKNILVHVTVEPTKVAEELEEVHVLDHLVRVTPIVKRYGQIPKFRQMVI